MAGPDRSLRRMLGELSTLAPRDYEAVLGRLDERQRARVGELLAELEGSPLPATALTPSPQFDAKAMPAGLSPWLLDRLGLPAEDGTTIPGAGTMTEHAAAALKICAAELDPAPPAAKSGPSLVGRLRRRLGVGLDSRMVGA